MKLKGIIIGTIVMVLLGSSQISAATPRPAINPDFDPDESCIIDIFQDKCDPGTEGECPEGFGLNEDGLCTHRTLVDGEWKWVCPDGYHSVYEDESGQCYPNEEGCRDDGFFLVEREDEDRNDTCAPLYTICDEEEVRNEDFCIEYCEENPDRFACKPESTSTGEEIIYDKNADLPICVYKETKDCKTKSGLICEAETTIDPCQDIFHGFTGTDENYKPETNQFIVPNN